MPWKTQTKPETETQPATTSSESEWVSSMHIHYQKTGLYRTRDLDRVLGDPRKQVSGEVSSDISLASRLSGK
jgi:hypothetical protein